MPAVHRAPGLSQERVGFFTDAVWWTPWVEIAWFGANALGSVLHRSRKKV